MWSISRLGLMGWLVVISIVLGTAFATHYTPRSLETSGMGGRVLLSTEIEATFGDAPETPCKATFTCVTAFKYGTSQCGYCSDIGSRWVCCTAGRNTTCIATGGGATPCGSGSTFKVGTLFRISRLHLLCNASGAHHSR